MNNFDSNSSGINIEFSAFYDCDLSRFYFEEAPVYCRLTVNSEEYYIDQDLKDVYSWDKSEVIEIAKNQLTSDNLPESNINYICNWLESNVKTDIEYQY